MDSKYYGLGRRKCAVAQVFISKSKSSKNEIFLNGTPKTFDFFSRRTSKILTGPFQIKILVSGGGFTGQKEAIFLALARALYQMGERPQNLTVDARVKERKKYGLKKARKAAQYSKR